MLAFALGKMNKASWNWGKPWAFYGEHCMFKLETTAVQAREKENCVSNNMLQKLEGQREGLFFDSPYT